MIVVLILLAAPSLATRTAPRASTKAYRYHTFTFPRPLNISDDQLIIRDLSPFVHNHSLSETAPVPPNGNKTALRITPLYYEADYPRLYHIKMFDMMKQSIYAAQDRLKYLQGLLDKYEEDQAFRSGYIFSKLDQLLEDMRRIYSFALKQYDYQSIFKNIMFFRHIAKKNLDVTYIVEFMQSFHDRNMKALAKVNREFGNV